MKVDKLKLGGIFDPTDRLEAPLFQRPYVWRREQNWIPLWEPMQALAENRLAGRPARTHFLGTIVLDQLKTPTGKVHARQIIDGQQRLTTLQVAIAAARDLCIDKHERYEKAFRKLTDNYVPLSDEPDDVFKVWPTNADRVIFREVLNAGSVEAVRKLPHTDPKDPWLIPNAYLFFADAFWKWLKPDGDGNGDLQNRLDALYDAIKDDLQMVVIDLEENDDAQVIFETLNALGTPLLPADLVKNFLFHLAEFQRLDTPKLYQRYWAGFDTEQSYWRAERRQGRLKRARLDVFLNHYLAMMTGEDVSASQLFSTFREFVWKNNGQCAETHMELFRSYADVYQSFDEFPRDSRPGLFFYRLEQMDTATPLPLLLEVCKRWADQEHRSELEMILSDLESFLVRRTVCELTTKNYNRFFVEMVKTLRDQDDLSGAAIRRFLLAETAETSRWPNDEAFKAGWMTLNFYTRLKRSKARMILEAIEAALHTGKTEKIQIDRQLTIEHLMPVEWKEHWPLLMPCPTPEAEEKATKDRNEILHKVGNLTLLTQKLNTSTSNGPWDAKRKAILQHSALNLNRAFQDMPTWNELTIFKRSEELFDTAREVWSYPGKPST